MFELARGKQNYFPLTKVQIKSRKQKNLFSVKINPPHDNIENHFIQAKIFLTSISIIKKNRLKRERNIYLINSTNPLKFCILL